MTYKEALAEILGKDHPTFADEYVGGVRDCPANAFYGASRHCPSGCSLEDSCRACWNREYQGEEYNPEYWTDDEEEEED